MFSGKNLCERVHIYATNSILLRFLARKRYGHLSERLLTGVKGVALIYLWLNQEKYA